jgi:hypothetical protein
MGQIENIVPVNQKENRQSCRKRKNGQRTSIFKGRSQWIVEKYQKRRQKQGSQGSKQRYVFLENWIIFRNRIGAQIGYNQ